MEYEMKPKKRSIVDFDGNDVILNLSKTAAKQFSCDKCGKNVTYDDVDNGLTLRLNQEPVGVILKDGREEWLCSDCYDELLGPGGEDDIRGGMFVHDYTPEDWAEYERNMAGKKSIIKKSFIQTEVPEEEAETEMLDVPPEDQKMMQLSQIEKMIADVGEVIENSSDEDIKSEAVGILDKIQELLNDMSKPPEINLPSPSDKPNAFWSESSLKKRAENELVDEQTLDREEEIYLGGRGGDERYKDVNVEYEINVYFDKEAGTVDIEVVPEKKYGELVEAGGWITVSDSDVDYSHFNNWDVMEEDIGPMIQEVREKYISPREFDPDTHGGLAGRKSIIKEAQTRMMLMTKALEKRFAQVGSQEDKGDDAIVIAHFFNPAGQGDWYATEYYPEDRTFFGFVSLFGDWNDELGYFSLDEFESVKGPFGLGIERDRYWNEVPLKEIPAYQKKMGSDEGIEKESQEREPVEFVEKRRGYERVNQKIRNAINKDLKQFNSPPFFDAIPAKEIGDVLEEHGFDGRVMEGIYTGDDGHMTEMIAPNSMVWMSWHKMESGRYEIVVYVS